MIKEDYPPQPDNLVAVLGSVIAAIATAVLVMAVYFWGGS